MYIHTACPVLYSSRAGTCCTEHRRSRSRARESEQQGARGKASDSGDQGTLVGSRCHGRGGARVSKKKIPSTPVCVCTCKWKALPAAEMGFTLLEVHTRSTRYRTDSVDRYSTHPSSKQDSSPPVSSPPPALCRLPPRGGTTGTKRFSLRAGGFLRSREGQ